MSRIYTELLFTETIKLGTDIRETREQLRKRTNTKNSLIKYNTDICFHKWCQIEYCRKKNMKICSS